MGKRPRAIGFKAIAGMLLAMACSQQLAAKSPDAAGVTTRFVHLAVGVPGVLYAPATIGPKATTAVFIMHSAADYLGFPGCTELARRGYRVLCANNSTSKSGASNDGVLDRVLLDARAGGRVAASATGREARRPARP